MTTILLGRKESAFAPAQLDRLRSLAAPAQLVITDDPEQMASVLEDVEIAAAGVPLELILRAPRLRWYQQWGAGADWLLEHPEAVERPFVLTNVSGIHAIPISEHILALMLAFARGLPTNIRDQERHYWEGRRERRVFELAGQTLLLIGVGAIGRRTALLAHALGMHVLGIRRHPGGAMPGIERLAGTDSLHEFLAKADIVALTVPLTRETRNMIGAAELRAMKTSAYIINIGRGGTIDETSLLAALREGWIAGAGLDVFDTEPLPADSPFWDMDNVIITPHYAGSTPYYDQRAMEIFLENLRRFKTGEPLQHVVNKQSGY